MDCQISFENISTYVDGMLSDESSLELTKHIATCAKCRNILCRLEFTKIFLEEKSPCNETIDDTVLNTIDKNRYIKRKNMFKFFKGFYTVSPMLRPAMALIFVCITLFITIGYGSTLVNAFNDKIASFKVQDMKPFNILFLEHDNFKHVDSILLVNYDPQSSKITTLSIPRDTYVDIKGEEKDKLSTLFAKRDTKEMAPLIEKLIHVDIKYYLYFNSSSLEKMIDALGGVDYTIPVDMNYDDPEQNLHIHFNKGQKHLDGKDVVNFMRFRRPSGGISKPLLDFYDGSDLKRISAQQKMIQEILKQKLNKKNLLDMKSVVLTGFQGIETDLSLSDSMKLLPNVSTINMNNITMMTLPVTSVQIRELSYYFIDTGKTKAILDNYFQTN